MRKLLLVTVFLAACGGGAGGQGPEVPQIPEKVETPPPIVVMFGDSIVARWQIPSGIVNAGVSGNTTLQLLDRFDRDVLARKPAVVILEGGVNDLDREWPPADVANNIAALVIRSQAAGARVLILSTLPTKYPHIKAAELNAELALVAKAYGVELIDTHSPFLAGGALRHELFVDGVHPNDAGYAVLWAAIRAAVERAVAR